jgi:hypothetical protein
MKYILCLVASIAIALACFGNFEVTRNGIKGECRNYTVAANGKLQESECSTTTHNNSFNASKENDQTRDNTITIHIKWVYPNYLEPWFAQYGESSLGDTEHYANNDNMSMTVTPYYGYPDIIIGYFRNPENPRDSYIVFEKVESLKDGVEITLDGSKAINKYELELLKPDYTPFSYAQIEYDPEEFTENITREGDLESSFNLMSVCIGGKYNLPLTESIIWLRDRINSLTGDRTNVTPPTWYMNELPEDCGFLVQSICMATDGDVYALMTNVGNTPGKYSNNPDLYKTWKFQAMPSKSAMEDGFGVYPKINLLASTGGFISTSLSMAKEIITSEMDKGVSVNMLICTDNKSSADFAGFETLVENQIVELLMDGSEGSLDMRVLHESDGKLSWLPYNMNLGFMAYGQDNLWTNNLEYGNHDDFHTWVNPYIPSGFNDYKGMPGNNVPTLSLLINADEEPFPEEMFPYLFQTGVGSGFVGRQGEARITDLFLTEVAGHKEGEHFIYNLTDSNILIDGEINGRNDSEIGLSLDKSDWIPPVLQLLSFNDSEGVVTDRFESGNNAFVEIYGGDFKYVEKEVEIENETYYRREMAVKPLKQVVIEWSPSGENDYAPIEVAENPDKFFVPGYGYCFTGSLKSVDKPSTNKWYDLRIRLEDESGNYVTQTIQPAFRMEKPKSGIEKIQYDIRDIFAGDSSVEVYTTSGIMIGVIYDRSGLDNFTPGVYILKSGDRVVKHNVR